MSKVSTFSKHLLLLVFFNGCHILASNCQEVKLFLVNVDSVSHFSSLGNHKTAMVDSIYQSYSAILKESVDSFRNEYVNFVKYDERPLGQSRRRELYFFDWKKRLEIEERKLYQIEAIADSIYLNFIETVIVELYIAHYGNRHLLVDSHSKFMYAKGSFLTNWFIQQIDPAVAAHHYRERLHALICQEAKNLMEE